MVLLVGGIRNQITEIIIDRMVPSLPGGGHTVSGAFLRGLTFLQGATLLRTAAILQDETASQAVNDL